MTRNLRPAHGRPALRRGIVPAAALLAAAAGGCRRPAVPQPALTGAPPAVAQAVRQATEAVRAAPHDAQRWGEYAMVLHANGFADTAEPAYREAMRRAPQDYRWPYLLGRLVAPRDPQAAEALLARAVRNNPQYVAARVHLARIAAQLGRTDQAGAHYAALVAQPGGEFFGHFGLGTIALARGQDAQAVEHLEQALQLRPHEPAVRAALAQALHRCGQRQRAAALLADLPATLEPPQPHDPLWFAMRARAGTVRARLERSELYRQAGRTDEALRELRAAQAEAPDNPYVLAALARLLALRGEYEAALASARRAAALAPELPGVQRLLAEICLELDRLDEAEQHARRATQDDPGARRVLGVVLARQGRYAQAAGEFEAAFRADPADLDAARLAAQAWLDAGRPQQARGIARQIVEAHPDDALGWTLLGWAELNAGQALAALSALRRAAELAPDLLPAVRGQAVALARSGMPQQAVQVLRAALARHPQDRQLAADLAWLLATHPDPQVRDGPAARELAEQLCAAPAGRTPAALERLAAAHAACGDFAAALRVADELIATARARGAAEEELERYRRQRAAYAAGRIWTQAP